MKDVKSENPVFRYARGEGRDDRRGLSRRQMVQQLLTGVGGSAALASIGRADSHQDQKQQPSPATTAAAGVETAGPAEWSPRFLDGHQNETLLVLAERIVPGSGQARVNRLIDLLLSVASEQDKRRFLQSLSAFDGEAIRRHRQPFASLNEEEQIEILKAASEGVPGQRRKEWFESGEEDVSHPGGEDEAMTLRNYFENVKEWVVRSYYNSEAGMKDLGWTGRVMWDSFPTCDHPGGHK
jgi:Gluconate 2-dehydrogenase subunit 3